MRSALGVAAAVDEGRLWDAHVEMGKIGGTPRGGVNRQASTLEDGQARALLVRWGRTVELANREEDGPA
jgi:N-carbamoyl-L-amino-acid hydrolase